MKGNNNMTMIHITNIEQLEKMINVLSKSGGHLEVYAEKKIKRDSDIDTVTAILKKCRSMINDIEKTEASEEALGWVQGAIIKLEKSKGEF